MNKKQKCLGLPTLPSEIIYFHILPCIPHENLTDVLLLRSVSTFANRMITSRDSFPAFWGKYKSQCMSQVDGHPFDVLKSLRFLYTDWLYRYYDDIRAYGARVFLFDRCIRGFSFRMEAEIVRILPKVSNDIILIFGCISIIFVPHDREKMITEEETCKIETQKDVLWFRAGELAGRFGLLACAFKRSGGCTIAQCKQNCFLDHKYHLR